MEMQVENIPRCSHKTREFTLENQANGNRVQRIKENKLCLCVLLKEMLKIGFPFFKIEIRNTDPNRTMTELVNTGVRD